MAGKYFSKATFDFLADLKQNNNRAWFADNKSRYEEKLKDPALRLIEDFGPELERIKAIVEIQRLNRGEEERLRGLRLRTLLDAPQAFASTYEELADQSIESWSAQLAAMPTFVAVDDTVDLGIARGATHPTCKSSAWLKSMWVDPAARGQGIGEVLIEAVAT